MAELPQLGLSPSAQTLPIHQQRPKLNRLQVNTCSADLSSWKTNKGVAADVYHVPKRHHDSVTSLIPDTIPNDFVSLLTYQDSPLSLSYHPMTFAASPTNEDILTQSQMFKAPDSEEFINCQKAEIEGIRKFDVIDIRHISTLPPKAKLLSSIWSYR